MTKKRSKKLPTVAPFRPVPDKPCKECPFRRKSFEGWLGRNPPFVFTNAIYREEPQPCHLSIDYEDKQWKEKWQAGEIGKLCRGALVMAANMGKLARDQAALPKVPPDEDEVFSHGSEFIAHHCAAKVRSWEIT